jgi:hypothetical protein
LTPSVIEAGNNGIPFSRADRADEAVIAFDRIVDAVIDSAPKRGTASIPISV